MQDSMPSLPAGAQLIQSYGPACFRIGNVEYASSVLVTPTATSIWNGEWTLEALAPLLHAQPIPEVILLGTGAQHRMVDKTLRVVLKNRGLAVDSMDTGAACRTFNILLSEGRRVAAALLLPR